MSRGVVFGPGGVPIQCKGGSMAEGVLFTKRLGLGAIEWELVHGAKVKQETAEKVGLAIKETRLRLSAHAPYYISLISHEHPKRKKSYEYVLDTARAVHYAGGGRVVFHPGFYGKWDKKKAFEEMKGEFVFLLEEIKKQKLNASLWPEVTGKLSAWGSLEELLEMRSQVKGIGVCIDFSHVHARSQGGLDSKKDFEKTFDLLESYGRGILDEMHAHFQSVRYGAKGELSHLEISEDSPPWKPFVEMLVERNCGGTIICESPVLEADALRMQKYYSSLAGK
ncbi:MAG: TIM barrel protein [Candidatus Norongarragalinales archaeon]